MGLMFDCTRIHIYVYLLFIGGGMLRVLEESTFNLLLSISFLETSLSLSDGVDRELCFAPPSSLT